TASEHATIEKSEGNRANPDENLVVVRNRLFDVFKSQNVIRRTVFAVTNSFHRMGRRAGLLIAIVRGCPVGELKPREEDDENGERKGLQLVHVESAQRLTIFQNDQDWEFKEDAGSLKSDRHEAEECHEQSDDPAHRSEQDIGDNRSSNIERDREDAEKEPQTEQ